MSRTRQGRRTSGADNYPTPAWAVRRFLDEWAALHEVGTRWLDPCVGDGIIPATANVYREGIEWTLADIRDTSAALVRRELIRRPEDLHVGSFFDLPAFEPGDEPRWDVAILNPPFRLALEFIERCLALCRYTVVLQRINYCGSEDRNAFFRGRMPDLDVIPNRISFTGTGKTDSVENAWHVWGPDSDDGIGIVRVLALTPLAERKEDRRRILAARDEVEVTLDALFNAALGDWDGEA